MSNRMTWMRELLLAGIVVLAPSLPAAGWDENGHGVVTVLAIRGTSGSLPAWLREREAAERLVYLASEPDRWRGNSTPAMTHWNNPDHYLDVELLEPYGLTLATLPQLRYEFVGRLAVAQSRNPERFASTEPDPSLLKMTPGMLPYRMMEMHAQLCASWRVLHTLELAQAAAGPYRIAAARERVIQTMGLMSHYVGDAAQPLHTTRHFNGWDGPNPHGYTVDKKFHQFIDGGVIDLFHIDARRLLPRALPARRIESARVWNEILAHIERSFEKVEPLYQIEKRGALRGAEGQAFIEERLLDAGAMLAGLWKSAAESAVKDDYLTNWLTTPNRGVSDKAASALFEEATEATAASRPSTP